MSISLADSSATTMPTAPVQPAPADASPAILWICIGWVVAGLIAAAILGAFRRKSIVGPQRLEPAESAWDLLIVLFISFFAGIVAYKALLTWFHPSPSMSIPLQAVPDLVTFIVGVCMLMRMQRSAVKAIGLSLRRIPAGLPGGAATLFVLYPMILLASAGIEKIYEHFHIKVEAHQILQFLNSSKDHRSNIIAIVLATVIAPVNEELLFRGLLQTLLTRFFGWVRVNGFTIMTGPQLSAGTEATIGWSVLPPVPPPGAGVRWLAVIVTSMLFALIHPPEFWIPIFVLAIGLGYVYERTGNLWTTMTAHALFNSSQILFFLSMRR